MSVASVLVTPLEPPPSLTLARTHALQKGHYSWLAVMVPLMLLVGGYLVMQVVDIVGDCIVRLVRCHLGLRNKVSE